MPAAQIGGEINKVDRRHAEDAEAIDSKSVHIKPFSNLTRAQAGPQASVIETCAGAMAEPWLPRRLDLDKATIRPARPPFVPAGTGLIVPGFTGRGLRINEGLDLLYHGRRGWRGERPDVTAGKQFQGLTAHLRETANAALRRLAGAKPQQTPDANAPDASFSDPAVGLDGKDGGGAEIPGNLSLSVRLDEAARDMTRRADRLREGADALATLIAQRGDGEIARLAQLLRAGIAAVWLGLAVWLAFGAGAQALAVAAEDASALARMFFLVGAAGLAAAAAIAAVIKITGKADNRAIRTQAAMLGRSIAETGRGFDEALAQSRSAMDRRSHAAQAVVDLSRAHIVALEACAFFREVAFLTGADEEKAHRGFQEFLRPPPASRLLPLFLAGSLMAAAAGVVLLTIAPGPDLLAAAPPGGVAQYPWAFFVVLLGGIVYAGAGLLTRILAGAAAPGGAADRARREGLAAMRAAYGEENAPPVDEIIERTQDALEILRGRLGAMGGGAVTARTNHRGPQSADFSPDEADIPPWRRRDSSVRFVESRFGAAPAPWRTDAYEKKLRREPDAKRGQAPGKSRPGK
jgi:hypothetical protein